MGYTKGDDFLNVVFEIKGAFEISDHSLTNHFPDTGKMVESGCVKQRYVRDLVLTRYADD